MKAGEIAKCCYCQARAKYEVGTTLVCGKHITVQVIAEAPLHGNEITIRILEAK
jgi:hypothetical protein